MLYEGHAVAAVAATSQAAADAALQAIDVDYEVLPHVLGLEQAMREDAPLLHDDVFTKGLSPKPDKPSNASMKVVIERGDIEAALAGAAVVASGRYTMEPVHQGYIEPHACVASWNADGQAQIWCSSQGAFAIRSLVASVLGIAQADIRVTPAGDRRRLRRQDDDLPRTGRDAAVEEGGSPGAAGDEPGRRVPRHRTGARRGDRREARRRCGRKAGRR